jgi:hypothetical protein
VLCCDWMVSDGVSNSESENKLDQYFSPGFVSLASGPLEEYKDLQGLYRFRFGDKHVDPRTMKEALYLGVREFKEILAKRGKSQEFISEILVCGFSVDKKPLILHVSTHGVTEIPGFAAIGSGGNFAEAALRWRQHTQPVNWFANLHDVVYRVYEGKRLAECADGVGELTTLAIMSPGSFAEELFTLKFAGFSWLDFLSERFKQYGPQSLPEQTDDIRYIP